MTAPAAPTPAIAAPARPEKFRWLPRGGTLPDPVWDGRHRHIVTAGYLLALGCLAFGLARGYSPLLALVGAGLVVAPAVLARCLTKNRSARSATAALALLNGCAVGIQFAGGATEAHFSFFVVIGLLTLYEDWVPFLLAIGYVVLHHGLMGTLMPHDVFDQPSAWHNPWTWAAVHGAFILAASATYLLAWRLNENYQAVAQESTERLVASEERFRALVQRSSDVTLVCDRSGVLSYVSPAAHAVLGLADSVLLGRRFTDLLVPVDRPQVAARLHPTLPDAGTDTARAGTGEDLQCRMLASDRTVRWLHLRIDDLSADPAVGGVVLHVRDITELHRLERDLRQAQKLESVGQLAAGIAHEINTPIQFVSDNLRFLGNAFDDQARVLQSLRAAAGSPQTTTDSTEAQLRGIDWEYLRGEVPQALEQTMQGVQRVADIVRAMRAFGLPQAEQMALADLNAAVRHTSVMAAHEVKRAARLDLDLGELPLVQCHLGELSQVLLNLIVNAAQAIAGSATVGELGMITVRTRQHDDQVVIEVSDTGPGVPDSVAERIFEPFYTTKPIGVGTGQGLSIAYALVHDRHGGTLGFRNGPTGGATFTVTLPISRPPVAQPCEPSDGQVHPEIAGSSSPYSRV